jgi:hypothetical protein
MVILTLIVLLILFVIIVLLANLHLGPSRSARLVIASPSKIDANVSRTSAAPLPLRISV